MYYVYVYRTERSGEIFLYGQKINIEKNQIFYVGKGKGRRAFSKKRNENTNLFIELFGCNVEIVKEGISEKKALELEVNVIYTLSMKGTILTNKYFYNLMKVAESRGINFDYLSFLLSSKNELERSESVK